MTGFTVNFAFGYYVDYFVYLLVIGLYALIAETNAENKNNLLKADYEEKLEKLNDKIEALQSQIKKLQ